MSASKGDRLSGNALNSSINFYVQKFSGESYLIGDSAPKAGDATSCRMLANQLCSSVSVSGATATVWQVVSCNPELRDHQNW